jgi:hypothetical protein
VNPPSDSEADFAHCAAQRLAGPFRPAASHAGIHGSTGFTASTVVLHYFACYCVLFCVLLTHSSCCSISPMRTTSQIGNGQPGPLYASALQRTVKHVNKAVHSLLLHHYRTRRYKLSNHAMPHCGRATHHPNKMHNWSPPAAAALQANWKVRTDCFWPGCCKSNHDF